MKITFLDGYTINPGDLDWSPLKKCGEFTVYDRTHPDEVLSRAADSDVLIVNKTALTEKHFEALPNLRLVCVAATGYDKVDVVSARQHGITVCNCAGYSSRSVAQMAVSLILEACDNVGEYTRLNHRGEWSVSKDFCYTLRPRIELLDKRVVIIGLGAIGHAVANVLRPFGVKLCAVSSKPQESLPEDIEKVTMKEAFSTADFISLNCPLTPENAGFIDAELLKLAKPNLVLVNTARGGLVNEQDLATALREKRVAAYCTDVLTQEPPQKDCPLLSAPNTYITPHIGWATPEARGRIVQIVADDIQAFMSGKPLNVVN